MIERILSATAVICAVLLIRGLLGGRMSLRLRYALWLLVLAGLLLPAAVPSPVSVLNALPQTAAAPAAVTGAPQAGVGQAAPMADTPADGGAAEPVEAPAAQAEPETVRPRRPAGGTQAPGGLTRRAVLGLVWLAGACGVGGWQAAVNLRFARRLRRARLCPELACEVPVYRADFLSSPCLAGVFRPKIYLTAGAMDPPGRVRHVLAHELCHRRHGDNWWALLRGVCLALWWFHPLVWLAAVLSRRDGELACDEGAVARLGEAERIPYGETLVGLVARRTAPADLLRACTAMTAGKKELKERVIRVAQRRKMPRAVLALALALAVGAGCCTLTGAADRSPERRVKETVTELIPYYGPVEGAPGIWQIETDQLDVSPRDLGYAIKDITPEAVGVAYDPAGEDEQTMRNVAPTWAVAFAQQFYHLPEDHPLYCDQVKVWQVFGFHDRTTASGLALRVNGHEGRIYLNLHPVNGLAGAQAYCEAPEGWGDEKTGALTVTFAVNLTRSTRSDGMTLWTCGDWHIMPVTGDYEEASQAGYTPMSLPVTVAPREGWRVDEVDLDSFCTPDIPGARYHDNRADNEELTYRWAYAYGQMYYALPEEHPYHAEEVRLLPGQGDADFTLAVKPSGGLDRIRPWFNGGCPEGSGELAGFVLLRYQVGLMKETIGLFGDKPVWVRQGSSALWATRPPDDPDTWDPDELLEQARMFYINQSIRAQGTQAQDLAAWGQVGADWAQYYMEWQLDMVRSSPIHAYQVQLLDTALTGYTREEDPRALEFTVRYAYRPTWGVETALAYHAMDGARYGADDGSPGWEIYRASRAWAGTGELDGWVVVELPGVRLQYYVNRYGEDWWTCVGVDGYTGEEAPPDRSWVTA